MCIYKTYNSLHVVVLTFSMPIAAGGAGGGGIGGGPPECERPLWPSLPCCKCKQKAINFKHGEYSSTCSNYTTLLSNAKKMFILNFDPKTCNPILPDLQTEHNPIKACCEEAKYQIGFILRR